MPKISITSEMAEKIKDWRKSFTAKEISVMLGLPYTTVQNHVKNRSGKRVLGKSPSITTLRKRIKVAGRSGYFNEHERENWLV